jgi:hypothetical protein
MPSPKIVFLSSCFLKINTSFKQFYVARDDTKKKPVKFTPTRRTKNGILIFANALASSRGWSFAPAGSSVGGSRGFSGGAIPDTTL